MDIGKNAPAFRLEDSNGKVTALADFKGKWVVLYFYPKDNTAGWTNEAKDFTGLKSKFKKANAVVIGISPDSVKSHVKFMEKQGLDLVLLSDPEHTALGAYGAWQLKKMYGREYMGVTRSTVLIDPEGIVRHTWPKVKVKGHAEDVLDTLRRLKR